MPRKTTTEPEPITDYVQVHELRLNGHTTEIMVGLRDKQLFAWMPPGEPNTLRVIVPSCWDRPPLQSCHVSDVDSRRVLPVAEWCDVATREARIAAVKLGWLPG